MLIALLAALGVDLIVIVALVASILTRKRWLKRQPGAFRGAIRVTSGELDGFGPKWRRGYGRLVRDVLVWTKAPLLLQNEIVPVDHLEGERSAAPGEVKRLGDEPIVAALTTDGARVEIATSGAQRDVLLDAEPAAVPARSRATPSI